MIKNKQNILQKVKKDLKISSNLPFNRTHSLYLNLIETQITLTVKSISRNNNNNN